MNLLLRILLLTCVSLNAWAENKAGSNQAEGKMDNQRMETIIHGLADKPEGRAGYWQFSMDNFQVTVITDEDADRMRIIVPVAKMANIDHGTLRRLMQANFDSALDARYSVARGVLWSAYIHPLSVLSDHQFIDGLAQTVNLAATYGSSYSSGALIFGGGDSQQEQNRYYREIIERSGSI